MSADYLTVDEAAQRWCPFVRFAFPAAQWNYNAPVDNRGDAEPIKDRRARCCCIARACMAWRDVPMARSGREDTGYCGLAGVPT